MVGEPTKAGVVFQAFVSHGLVAKPVVGKGVASRITMATGLDAAAIAKEAAFFYFY